MFLRSLLIHINYLVNYQIYRLVLVAMIAESFFQLRKRKKREKKLLFCLTLERMMKCINLARFKYSEANVGYVELCCTYHFTTL